MEQLTKRISELDQFAEIISRNDESWLPLFRHWFNTSLELECRQIALCIALNEEPVELCYTMPADDLSGFFYSLHIEDIFKSARYRSEKLDWWNKVYKSYQNALPVYDRLRKRGLLYTASHIKKIGKSINRIREKNLELTMVDIIEIAFARYAAEAKGNYLSFQRFMR